MACLTPDWPCHLLTSSRLTRSGQTGKGQAAAAGTSVGMLLEFHGGVDRGMLAAVQGTLPGSSALCPPTAIAFFAANQKVGWFILLLMTRLSACAGRSGGVLVLGFPSEQLLNVFLVIGICH